MQTFTIFMWLYSVIQCYSVKNIFQAVIFMIIKCNFSLFLLFFEGNQNEPAVHFMWTPVQFRYSSKWTFSRSSPFVFFEFGKAWGWVNADTIFIFLCKLFLFHFSISKLCFIPVQGFSKSIPHLYHSPVPLPSVKDSPESVWPRLLTHLMRDLIGEQTHRACFAEVTCLWVFFCTTYSFAQTYIYSVSCYWMIWPYAGVISFAFFCNKYAHVSSTKWVFLYPLLKG